MRLGNEGTRKPFAQQKPLPPTRIAQANVRAHGEGDVGDNLRRWRRHNAVMQNADTITSIGIDQKKFVVQMSGPDLRFNDLAQQRVFDPRPLAAARISAFVGRGVGHRVGAAAGRGRVGIIVVVARGGDLGVPRLGIKRSLAENC